MQLNVLVVGGGGREHALAWKLASSERCETLFCSPGNAGIAMETGIKVEADLNISNHQEVLQASLSHAGHTSILRLTLLTSVGIELHLLQCRSKTGAKGTRLAWWR